jgi:hypothetical protein
MDLALFCVCDKIGCALLVAWPTGIARHQTTECRVFSPSRCASNKTRPESDVRAAPAATYMHTTFNLKTMTRRARCRTRYHAVLFYVYAHMHYKFGNLVVVRRAASVFRALLNGLNCHKDKWRLNLWKWTKKNYLCRPSWCVYFSSS